MSKVDTNATAETTAAAAAVPAPKAPTKADLARPIFAELTKVGAELPEGKTARAEFIRRAQEEAGLTAKGAATYWQNLTKAARGEPMYGKKKVAEVPKVEGQTDQAAGDAQSAADAQAEGGAQVEGQEQAQVA